METLFDNDPTFKVVRDRRGRFATPERALYEKTAQENSYLRLEVERYKRQAEVLSRSVTALENKLNSLRTIILL